MNYYYYCLYQIVTKLNLIFIKIYLKTEILYRKQSKKNKPTRASLGMSGTPGGIPQLGLTPEAGSLRPHTCDSDTWPACPMALDTHEAQYRSIIGIPLLQRKFYCLNKLCDLRYSYRAC